MRILLDTGVFIHSEFAQHAIRPTTVRWGNRKHEFPVHCTVRKPTDQNAEYQEQKEALFTVGRLIREGRVEAYDYSEIGFERLRGRKGFPICDALNGCSIHRCPPALERSRFRKTTDFADFISKGGKKERRDKVSDGEANQIAFFTWLYNLKKEQIDVLVPIASRIGLTDFEIESLKDIAWFQFLCQRSQSPENYPDVFHLWTAERNRLDALLTLDAHLPNLVRRVRNEKVRKVEIRTEVLRPLDLLQRLGIDQPDAVPLGY